MGDSESIEAVERSDDFYHVRFHDPNEFDTIRTPEWAREAAESIVDGSEVRTGHRDDSDEWDVQSVLIPVDSVDNEDHAADMAENVVSKVQS